MKRGDRHGEGVEGVGVVFHSDEGDEEFVGGEAYVVGPGHTPVIYAGTSLVEFSPTDRLQETLEVVSRNMESASE